MFALQPLKSSYHVAEKFQIGIVTARPQLFCRGCGPFVPAFVAYDT